MKYLRIASTLEEVRGAPRSERIEAVATLISSSSREVLCPAVRLLTGEIWPSWTGRVMGVGFETVVEVLKGISSLDVTLLREELEDLGSIAEKAIERRPQRVLSSEPLSVLEVYWSLHRISEQKGELSLGRKEAILRGLFLRAEPIEAKYLAMAALRGTLPGLGPSTTISAIGRALGLDFDILWRAYSRMPDIGSIALAAESGELNTIRARPSVPIRPMIFRPGLGTPLKLPGAFLARRPGLRVQVHIWSGGFSVYTMRLRNITPSLSGLYEALAGLEHEMVADAELVGVSEGSLVSQAELISYINRKKRSRRSKISPALLATDLLYIDGEELMERRYSERRSLLISSLGEPHGSLPSGISTCEEEVNDFSVEERLKVMRSLGFECLVYRDLDGTYLPGSVSRSDFLIVGAERSLIAVVIGADFSQTDEGRSLSRFHLALRDGDGLVPVGWVSIGLAQAMALSEEIGKLYISKEEGHYHWPNIVIKVKLAGARIENGSYSLIRPRILEVRPGAPLDEADGIEKLEVT